MKATLVLFAATFVLAHAEPLPPVAPATLAGAEVRLPYDEFRRLLDTARATESASLPVPAALLAARIHFDPSTEPPALRATFRTSNFGERWELVPLMAEVPPVAQATPAESRLVVDHGNLCLLLAGREQQSVDVAFSAQRGNPAWSFATLPCPSAVVEVAAPPAGREAVVAVDGQETILLEAGTLPLPAAGSKVALTTRPRQQVVTTDQGIAATDAAVVQEAAWSTRLEAGGAVLTQGKLKVEHRGASKVKFVLPDGCRLLACTLGARPVEPVELAPGTLEITLPGTGESTRSELGIAFTARQDAFHPGEGVCALALPLTPLFIHATLWEVNLPDGYVAETHGNLERVAANPDDGAGALRLRKLLCRDERPTLSVFYSRAGLAE